MAGFGDPKFTPMPILEYLLQGIKSLQRLTSHKSSPPNHTYNFTETMGSLESAT